MSYHVSKFIKNYPQEKIATMQYTIPDDAEISDYGISFIDDAERKYLDGKFKSHLENWSLKISNSGIFYGKDHVSLNSWHNRVIESRIIKDGSFSYITTSPIIYINPQDKWCVTLSGSVYSLDKETKLCDKEAKAWVR